ncbi:HAMP domain-containing sensor histidine kinase [Enterococcus casseliflavus]|uniref:HAMP domain-containing sensor histidine kinase n=1 Tax=Enterococcus TaxID=1350 RepID=UPI000789B6E1|nr:HAMP domain-containing sensor histidine kinase [Enterococcus pernyi]
MKINKVPNRWVLTLIFTGLVFMIFIITMVIMAGLILLLRKLNIFSLDYATPEPWFPIFILAILSVIVGTVVSTIISRIPLKPVNQLINGMRKLAGGDYSTKIDLGRSPIGKDVSQNFNLMAKELSTTELLRTDFVNNLSHEFKTPIVSISGFAKLLRKKNLSEKENEYLDIIISESERLADMSTNLLNLAKIENQNILTDTIVLNLSEQIRESILILESKWQSKKIIVNINFSEVFLVANERLLKQVWINLIENSIKFSPEGSEITISINDDTDLVKISILNKGPKIESNDINRIFNKYWKADLSHTTEGTGVGLSIVKKIIELHHGKIEVDSTSDRTVFDVFLPNFESNAL